ncbi:MAG: SDR family NAD(P)-dependent oxidoreductase [Solirubrobacteraceae bacterium]
MSARGGGLGGRVALVTGAGRGIGREIALRLAADGVAVALAGRSTDALHAVRTEIEGAGGSGLVVAADVRQQDSVEQLFELAARRLGPIDVVVANSGVAGPTKPIWSLELEEWEQTLAVNLTGVFLTCRAAARTMIERGRGSIVVIGSATGKNPMAQRTPYAASKAGLIGLVRTLAWDLGSHGVRVNLVSPGATEGERLDEVIERHAQAAGAPDEKLRESLAKRAALGRLTRGSDVAAAVAFLAEDASAGITGEDLNVSAGWVMH